MRHEHRGWGSLHPLLDLHGLTADEAVRRVEEWLRQERSRGTRTVVIVTGRGNRSVGPPVLRGEVEHLMARLRGSVIARWQPTRGGGAFRVELAPPDPPPAQRGAVRRMAAADPALRARAEQALWELGITPTPLLIEAEIRRLLRDRDAGTD